MKDQNKYSVLSSEPWFSWSAEIVLLLDRFVSLFELPFELSSFLVSFFHPPEKQSITSFPFIHISTVWCTLHAHSITELKSTLQKLKMIFHFQTPINIVWRSWNYISKIKCNDSASELEILYYIILYKVYANMVAWVRVGSDELGRASEGRWPSRQKRVTGETFNLALYIKPKNNIKRVIFWRKMTKIN